MLLESNRGDYTFPGGGIEYNESHHETLAREVLEETGYTCSGIDEAIRKNKEYSECGKTVNFCIQQEIYVLELIRDNTEDDSSEGRVYR